MQADRRSWPVDPHVTTKLQSGRGNIVGSEIASSFARGAP
jgi:hypothetical protein